MTEKSDKTQQVDKSATSNKPKAASAAPAPSRKKSTGPVVLTVIAAAVIGGGALWYVQQNQEHIQQQYHTQLQQVVAQAQKNQETSAQALQQVQNQHQQLQQLQQELAHTKEQLADMRVALQTISDSGSDLMLLNDIEQLVILAQQQLLIGGNLANAIVSLETAQARLSQANRQSLAVLIQTLNGDLDRLRTAQVVDVSSITAQLDRLADLVDKAPLYVPDAKNSNINGQVSSTIEPAADTEVESDVPIDAPWWQKTLSNAAELTQKGWKTISQDLGQFVSVRRVDDSAALLMSAEQADRFREHLRLRITMAQLALMTKQPKVWQAEMGHVVDAIEQRFDPSLAITQRALSLATQLADTNIDVKLPTIDNTLAAIESLKQAEQSDAPVSVPDLPTSETDTKPAPADEPKTSDAVPETNSKGQNAADSASTESDSLPADQPESSTGTHTFELQHSSTRQQVV